MNKGLIAVLAGSLLALVSTGCTSFETNRVGDQITVHMDTTVKPQIEASNKTVEGQAKVNCLFGIFTWGVSNQALGVDFYGNGSSSPGFFISPADTAKNGATYNACADSKADLLLAPRYNLTVTDYFVFKIYDCTVKGYPGVLKSIKVINK